MRKHVRSFSALVAIVSTLILLLGPSPVAAHGEVYVDEYPDDPYVCGGGFEDAAWCGLASGGTSFKIEMTYEAEDPSTEVWVHGTIRIVVPETTYGVLVVECDQTGTGSASCVAEIGPELSADLPPVYEFECAGHVHLTPSIGKGSGRFLCTTGDRTVPAAAGAGQVAGALVR